MTLNRQRLLDEIEWVEKQDRIERERGWSEWWQRSYALDAPAYANCAAGRRYAPSCDYFDAPGTAFDAIEDVRQELLDEGCGSAFCLAGHVTHTDHPEWSIEKVNVDAYFYAMDVLGLTDDEADYLFDGDNTAAQMRAIATQIIAAHDGERLETAP